MRQKTIQTYLTILLAVALMLIVSCTSAQPAANAPAEKATQPVAKTEEAKPTEKPAATEAPAAPATEAPAAPATEAPAATEEASTGNSCPAYPTGTAERIESVDIEKEFGALPEPKPGLKMAYVTKTLINEFWQDVAVGIQDEAKKHGIEVQIQAAKDESSLSEQLDLAQTILSQKPDALLISPQSDSNLMPVIEAAKELNIPTIIIDDARTEGASTYVGTDQVAIGAKAAEYIHKMFPDGGKVAQIEGQAGSPNARNRIKGFKDTVAKYPNLELVASQPGNWDRLTALNAATNILQENPDLIAFYANNDGMALGVLEAVKNTGSKALVVGTDGIREAKKSIGEEGMASTVAEFPYDEGILGVQMAIRLLNCQAIPPWVVSPQAVIEKDNLDQFPNPPGFEQPGATEAPAATEEAAPAATEEASTGNSCPAYPTGTVERIESVDIEKEFGALPEPKPGLKMAYVTKTLINEFWQDVAVGIQDEAKKHGIEVQIQAAKDESSLSEQLDLAQTILSQKPDALLISPQSDSNLMPVIEAAKELNIPTIIIDDARTEGASTYVGTDQVAIGAKAAEYIHKMFPDGGKVAQIEGQAGSPNARNRIKGFKDTVAKYPNLELVASQPGNWDRLTALNAATNILQENPDLIAFYANNDGMALGVLEAVKNTGSKALVVGTDGIREAKKSIGEEGMASTVAEFPYDEGILGVQMAIRLLNCQAIPPWVVSPQAVIEKDNLDQFPNPPAFQ